MLQFQSFVHDLFRPVLRNHNKDIVWPCARQVALTTVDLLIHTKSLLKRTLRTAWTTVGLTNETRRRGDFWGQDINNSWNYVCNFPRTRGSIKKIPALQSSDLLKQGPRMNRTNKKVSTYQEQIHLTIKNSQNFYKFYVLFQRGAIIYLTYFVDYM